MIRTFLTCIIFLAASVAGHNQTDTESNSLIRARYLVTEKMYEESFEILRNSQPSASDQGRFALTTGQALSGLGRYVESNKWLLQVSGEGLADAMYLIAKNYLSLNDEPNAIQHLSKHLADKNHYTEKRIRLDPDFARLENNRDWIHLWQTEWYSVVEQQIAEFDYLISQGQSDDAGVLANKVLADFPGEAAAWFAFARLSLIQKEEKQYRQALDKAWQLASGNIPLKGQMLQFAMETSNYDKAAEMAGDLIRRDATNSDYQITRTLIRILNGKESMAYAEIKGAEAAGIAPVELYYQAGQKLSAARPLEAESYLSKAINSGTLDARFFYSRGMVRNTLEKPDLALEDLAMSLDINPIQPDLYMDRAQIRYNRDDTEGACHDWQKALAMGKAKAADMLYKYCKLP